MKKWNTRIWLPRRSDKILVISRICSLFLLVFSVCCLLCHRHFISIIILQQRSEPRPIFKFEHFSAFRPFLEKYSVCISIFAKDWKLLNDDVSVCNSGLMLALLSFPCYFVTYPKLLVTICFGNVDRPFSILNLASIASRISWRQLKLITSFTGRILFQLVFIDVSQFT